MAPGRSLLYLSTLMLVLTVVAGCLGGEETDDASPEPGPELGTFVNPMIEGHDHSDPALHQMYWNMVRTGGSLLDEGLRGHAAPHALDVKNDLLFVSAYAATLDRVAGVYIFDLGEDPLDPPLIGKWLTYGAGAGDRNMEATADGAFVVVSYEAYDCAGNVGPLNAGMHLLDTSDPTDPVAVDHVLITPGETGLATQHSITIFSTDAGDFVYHGSGDSLIYRIDRGSKSLVPVGEFRSGHDSSVFIDPATGTPYLLSADVSRLTILDLTDPSAPEVVGFWNVPDPHTYYVHTAVGERLNGRNIVVVNSEDFRQDPTSFWILDITDPSAPEVLSQWTAPDDIPSGDLTFSLHNPRLQGGILTFSVYHAGVWQFDLNDPESWTDPQPRAYYLPTEPVGRASIPDGSIALSKVCGILLDGPTTIPPGSGPTGGSLDIQMDAVPFTFDVEMHNGVVYVADVNTGIHALVFEPGNTLVPDKDA